MTKADIIGLIADGTGLTKVETQAVVDGFLATVSFALRNGERVHLGGFGNFKIVRRSARTARNPRTNEPVYVPEHLTAIFRPAKDLKDYVNNPKNTDF